MNSRLLFAAARGARIQWQTELGGWKTTPNILPKVYGPAQWRIHPEDEHLQYGPVSTALRDEAEVADIESLLCAIGDYGMWSVNYGTWCEYKDCWSELHRSLFLLILSEALADEGL